MVTPPVVLFAVTLAAAPPAPDTPVRPEPRSASPSDAASPSAVPRLQLAETTTPAAPEERLVEVDGVIAWARKKRDAKLVRCLQPVRKEMAAALKTILAMRATTAPARTSRVGDASDEHARFQQAYEKARRCYALRNRIVSLHGEPPIEYLIDRAPSIPRDGTSHIVPVEPPVGLPWDPPPPCASCVQ